MKKTKHILLLITEFAVAAAALYWARDALVHNHHHEINTIMPILIDIAFLAVFASLGGKLAKDIGIAPMAGMIALGVIAGPAVLGTLPSHSVGVEFARMAGVLFILFEAGLHFDLHLLKKYIKVATIVAFAGVLIPLITFVGLGLYFFNLPWIQAAFLGGIFTATSVGLAVEALRKAGKLSTPLGTKIIAAAVIDDILGVIMLTALVKMSEGHFEVSGLLVLLLTVALFIIATFVLWNYGFADRIAKYLNRFYDHNIEATYTRFFFGALVLGSALAAIVGLEPVLGAFGAGVVISKIDDQIKHDAWEKIEGYMHIFVGGFLVSIGTLLTKEALVSLQVWMVAIVFTWLAFYGKFVVAYMLKNREEGALIGSAMAIRGEVGLVFIAVAISNNALRPDLASAALLAVILVTVWGAIEFERRIQPASQHQ